ncbi:hypothetical protein THAOC_34090, partial [Thalassiosira oceanica]
MYGHLIYHRHHSQQTSATYARSSAGPRIHYLDAPQTQPSSARLQRQQAGRGRDSESEPILTGPGNLVSFFLWGKDQTARPCVGPGGPPSMPMCAPKGVPSSHEEGEARQLKTNTNPQKNAVLVEMDKHP